MLKRLQKEISKQFQASVLTRGNNYAPTPGSIRQDAWHKFRHNPQAMLVQFC